MRAVLINPKQGATDVAVDIPDVVDVILCGGQVFERSFLLHPSGAVAYRQVHFVSLDPSGKDLNEAIDVALEALQFVKIFFRELEDRLPITESPDATPKAVSRARPRKGG